MKPRKLSIQYSKTQKENQKKRNSSLFNTGDKNRIFVEVKEKQPPILKKSTVSQMGGSRKIARTPSRKMSKSRPEEALVADNWRLAKLMKSGIFSILEYVRWKSNKINIYVYIYI